MLKYEKFTLDNGLRVIFHQDKTTPLCVVNTLYDVGARDENPKKTGFAHLFEHLMFGGSINIPDFDNPLQNAGGENNAFTSNDITNYYDVVPVQNIETVLWLESDRMLSLAFTDKSLEVQRNVVIEEFKQRYLNQPYGDVWLELRPLTYKVHPYLWATIGKSIEHIENATMDDVKAFFQQHYNPSNAILGIAGNLELSEVKELVNKWYGTIPSGEKYHRQIQREPKQEEFRTKTIERPVPANAFYYAFKMTNRKDREYYTADVLSDLLGRDKSSRLYLQMKKNLNLVSSINSYITGSFDEGLLIITGKLNEGVTFDQVDEALWDLLSKLRKTEISDQELKRVLNKIRTSKEFQDRGVLNRIMNLCVNELLGDIEMVNHESEIYKAISKSDIQRVANKVLDKKNCSLLKVNANVR